MKQWEHGVRGDRLTARKERAAAGIERDGHGRLLPTVKGDRACRGMGQKPAPLSRDAHGIHSVVSGEGGKHGGGAPERDLVFLALTAEEQNHIHIHHLASVYEGGGLRVQGVMRATRKFLP